VRFQAQTDLGSTPRGRGRFEAEMGLTNRKVMTVAWLKLVS